MKVYLKTQYITNYKLAQWSHNYAKLPPKCLSQKSYLGNEDTLNKTRETSAPTINHSSSNNGQPNYYLDLMLSVLYIQQCTAQQDLGCIAKHESCLYYKDFRNKTKQKQNRTKKKKEETNAQTIYIHKSYRSSLTSALLQNQPSQSLSYCIPLYNSMFPTEKPFS